MTAFTRKSFSVAAPGNDAYRDAYEKTFGKKGRDAERTSEDLVREALSLIDEVKEQISKASAELFKLANDLDASVPPYQLKTRSDYLRDLSEKLSEAADASSDALSALKP